MTRTINNVPRELKPVLAMILNALDRDAADGKQARAEMAAELRALLSAPSPAGVDGCKGKNCGATDGASHSAECIAEHEQACGRADSNGLPVVACLIGGEPSLTPCPVRGVVSEPLCRLSDAQAIIDGLRGEVASQEETANQWRELALQFDRHRMTAMAHIRAAASGDKSAIEALGVFAALPPILGHEITAARDQQAKRIGELEGLLLRVQVSLSLDDTEWGYSGAEKYKLLADIRAALSAGKDSGQ